MQNANAHIDCVLCEWRVGFLNCRELARVASEGSHQSCGVLRGPIVIEGHGIGILPRLLLLLATLLLLLRKKLEHVAIVDASRRHSLSVIMKIMQLRSYQLCSA